MAKDKKTTDNNGELSDAQLKRVQKQAVAGINKTFGKWMTAKAEKPSKEFIDSAIAEFDAEVERQKNTTFKIADKENALEYAKMLKEWNTNYNSWSKGAWRGVIMFDNRIVNIINDLITTPSDLVVDYETLVYLYNAMGHPAGTGLDSALAMAKFENLNVVADEPIIADNYVTYSHLLQTIVDKMNEFSAVDKKLKLMRERIGMLYLGITVEFKISDVAEFVELHDAWIANGVAGDDKQ